MDAPLRSNSQAYTQLDKVTLSYAKNLKVIGMPGVGLDHIDVTYAKERGIIICNVPGGNVDAVAELTIGHILMLLRNMWCSCRSVREKQSWNKYPYMGRELNGRRIGVIGFGRIGMRVAQIAQAFRMEVSAYDPFLDSRKVPKGITLMEFNELLQWGDIFTIHAPLTPQTYHMINEDAISLMHDGAYIVNMSRGGLIDENAIYTALKSGHLGGVGSDVMETEPAPGTPIPYSPLFDLPNFMVTPHLGAWTSDTQKRIAVIIAEKMLEALKSV